MWKDGGWTVRKVHVMVLEAFRGSRPEGKVARHLNGDALDNRLVNLVWGTGAENVADRDRHGRTVRGTRQHAAKLTESTAREILESTEPGVVLARRYGVSTGLICHIKHRRAWAWI